MASKYMKMCLTFLAIMEIKTGLLLHLIPVRTAVSRKQTTPKTDKDVRKNQSLYQKLKIELPCNPDRLFLAVYLKESKLYHGDGCISVFTVALFKGAKLCDWLRSPSAYKFSKVI